MKRVIVGLSGGVDSSVAAFLLKRQGLEVMAVSLNLYREEDTEAAENVASFLKIPFKVLNLRKEFREKIMDYFAREYRRGRTPNPCALCNPYIKFRYLEEVRREEKADFIATGHYARIVEKGRKFYLVPAKDRKKSQEYFLAMLDEEILRRTVFPLGELSKERVKEIARREGIPALEREESQDVCFVKGEYWKFLEDHYSFTPQKGDIIHTSGKVLGTHTGYYRFTPGQRRGLGVSSTSLEITSPLYVVRILPEENKIVVGSRDELMKTRIKVELKNWRGGGEGRYLVRIRYRHQGEWAEVKISGKNAEVKFKRPQFAPAPGQIAVFYDQEELVRGAGIIL